jgi:Zn-finger nucleic acid-binding protein
MPVKPGEKEEEYFAREEFKRKKKEQEDLQLKLETEEKKRLKELHYMHCPKCGLDLIEINYKGIAVDKCSSCEGVWLDAGELEAISELEKGILDRWFTVFKKSG